MMEMDSNPITKPSKKGAILSTVFYALAVVLLITAFVSLAACHQNITRQLEQGVPVQGNELAIVNLYLTSCVQYFAFAAAIAGTWIFVWFIQRIQFKDVVMVPLVGIMFGNVIGGITNYLAYQYEMTQALSTWEVGHFSLVVQGRYELVYLAVPMVILAFLFANHFNIVGMGKDFSRNLGVPYNLVLFGGLTIAAMITASVVVVVGAISYIGLIVPNVVAMFKGDRIRGTLVDTALFGAIFVLGCDVIARTVIAPYELPIELVVGILGSVIFIALLLYRLNHGRKAVRLGPAHSGGCAAPLAQRERGGTP